MASQRPSSARLLQPGETRSELKARAEATRAESPVTKESGIGGDLSSINWQDPHREARLAFVLKEIQGGSVRVKKKTLCGMFPLEHSHTHTHRHTNAAVLV